MRPQEEIMVIDAQTLVIWLVIGAIAGWLAGQVMRGGGFGLVGNVVVGIVGAVVAGWLFPNFWPSMGSPMVNAIVHAFVGAIIVLLVVGLIRRA
jgi:uncharacterized membrane protein YeaQ/YmgE (transglycosylase-associated protein family)